MLKNIDYTDGIRFYFWEANDFCVKVKEYQKNRSIELFSKLAINTAVRNSLENKKFDYFDIHNKDSQLHKDYLKLNLKEINFTYNTEIVEGLVLMNFFGLDCKLVKIGFPVNKKCPENINIEDINKYKEDNSSFDIIIQGDNQKYYIQLKDYKENEFNTNTFNSQKMIEKIERDVSKYRDKNMTIVYFLQTQKPKNTLREVLEIFSEVRDSLIKKINIDIKNIYFFGSESKTVFTLTEFYPEYRIFRLTENKILWKL